jgi:hypothetical protein
MSQHFFDTTCNGRAVYIMAGWDRPLRGVFVLERGTDEVIYSNLEDPALARSMGFASSIDYFADKLATIHLAMPPAMIREIEKDTALNVGNRQVQYDAGGRIEERS